MKTEQKLLKALLNVRAELVGKLTFLKEAPDPRYPKSFIEGMYCAYRDAIMICDENTKQFFDK